LLYPNSVYSRLKWRIDDPSQFEVTSGSRKESVKIDLKRELGKEAEETIVKDIELKGKMNSKEADEEVDLRQEGRNRELRGALQNSIPVLFLR